MAKKIDIVDALIGNEMDSQSSTGSPSPVSTNPTFNYQKQSEITKRRVVNRPFTTKNVPRVFEEDDSWIFDGLDKEDETVKEDEIVETKPIEVVEKPKGSDKQKEEQKSSIVEELISAKGESLYDRYPELNNGLSKGIININSKINETASTGMTSKEETDYFNKKNDYESEYHNTEEYYSGLAKDLGTKTWLAKAFGENSIEKSIDYSKYSTQEEVDRAKFENQSNWDVFGNTVAGLLGNHIFGFINSSIDTYAMIGEIIDSDKENYNNSLGDNTQLVSEYVKGVQQSFNEKYKIHQNPDGTGDLTDPYHIAQAVSDFGNSTGFMASLIAGSGYTRLAGGILKGATKSATKIATKVLPKQAANVASGAAKVVANAPKWVNPDRIKRIGSGILETGVNAGMSRGLESYVNAEEVKSSIYQDSVNSLLNMSEEDLKEFMINNPQYDGWSEHMIANDMSERYSKEVFEDGMKLTAIDFFQWAVLPGAIRGISPNASTVVKKASEKAIKGLSPTSKLSKVTDKLIKAGTFIGSAGLEGFEEGFQMVSQLEATESAKAELDKDYVPMSTSEILRDQSVLESTIIGAVSGGVFNTMGEISSSIRENKELKNFANYDDSVSGLTIEKVKLDEIKARQEKTNEYIRRMSLINSGKNPDSIIDGEYEDLTSRELSNQKRLDVSEDYIKDLVYNATDADNYSILEDYLTSPQYRNLIREQFSSQEQADEYTKGLVKTARKTYDELSRNKAVIDLRTNHNVEAEVGKIKKQNVSDREKYSNINSYLNKVRVAKTHLAKEYTTRRLKAEKFAEEINQIDGSINRNIGYGNVTSDSVNAVYRKAVLSYYNNKMNKLKSIGLSTLSTEGDQTLSNEITNQKTALLKLLTAEFGTFVDANKSIEEQISDIETALSEANYDSDLQDVGAYINNLIDNKIVSKYNQIRIVENIPSTDAEYLANLNKTIGYIEQDAKLYISESVGKIDSFVKSEFDKNKNSIYDGTKEEQDEKIQDFKDTILARLATENIEGMSEDIDRLKRASATTGNYLRNINDIWVNYIEDSINEHINNSIPTINGVQDSSESQNLDEEVANETVEQEKIEQQEQIPSEVITSNEENYSDEYVDRNQGDIISPSTGVTDDSLNPDAIVAGDMAIMAKEELEAEVRISEEEEAIIIEQDEYFRQQDDSVPTATQYVLAKFGRDVNSLFDLYSDKNHKSYLDLVKEVSDYIENELGVYDNTDNKAKQAIKNANATLRLLADPNVDDMTKDAIKASLIPLPKVFKINQGYSDEYNEIIEKLIDSYNKKYDKKYRSKTPVINIMNIVEAIIDDADINYESAKLIIRNLYNYARYINSPFEKSKPIKYKFRGINTLRSIDINNIFNAIRDSKTERQIVSNEMHISAPTRTSDNKSAIEALSVINNGDQLVAESTGGSIMLSLGGVQVGYLGKVSTSPDNKSIRLSSQTKGLKEEFTKTPDGLIGKFDSLFTGMILGSDKDHIVLYDKIINISGIEESLSGVDESIYSSFLNDPIIQKLITNKDILFPSSVKTSSDKGKYVYKKLSEILFYNGADDTTSMLVSYNNYKYKFYNNYVNTKLIQDNIGNGKVQVKYKDSFDSNVLRGDSLSNVSDSKYNFTEEVNKIVIINPDGSISVDGSDRVFKNPAGFYSGEMGIVIKELGESPVIALFKESNLIKDTNKDLANAIYKELNGLFKGYLKGDVYFDELKSRLSDLLGGPDASAGNMFAGYKVLSNNDVITLKPLNSDVNTVVIFRSKPNGERGDIIYRPENGTDSIKRFGSNNSSMVNSVAKGISGNLKYNRSYYPVRQSTKRDVRDNQYVYKEDGKLVFDIGESKISYNSYTDFILKSGAFKTDLEVKDGSYFNKPETISSFNVSVVVGVTPVEEGQSSTTDLTNVDMISMLKTTSDIPSRDVLESTGIDPNILDVIDEYKSLGINLIPDRVSYSANSRLLASYRPRDGKIRLHDKALESISRSESTEILRSLVHEQLHKTFADNSKNGKSVINERVIGDLKETFSQFVEYVNYDIANGETEDIINNAKELRRRYFKVMERYANKDGELFAEEWLVESLTQSDLIKYLNSKTFNGDINTSTTKTLWQKIFDAILRFFDKSFEFTNNNSILRKHYEIFTDSDMNINNNAGDDISDGDTKEISTINENDVLDDPFADIDNVDVFSADQSTIEQPIDYNDQFLDDSDLFSAIPSAESEASIDILFDSDMTNNPGGVILSSNMNDYSSSYDSDVKSDISNAVENKTINFVCR